MNSLWVWYFANKTPKNLKNSFTLRDKPTNLNKNNYHLHCMCDYSTNAWLASQLDRYKIEMQDATSKLLRAEDSLSLTPMCLEAITHYYTTCMNLAHLALRNGDDQSYLNSLQRNYSRMMLLQNASCHSQLNNVTYSYARSCLESICCFYNHVGEDDKASQFRSHFIHNVSK